LTGKEFLGVGIECHHSAVKPIDPMRIDPREVVALCPCLPYQTIEIMAAAGSIGRCC
jgi:hypothetical protein